MAYATYFQTEYDPFHDDERLDDNGRNKKLRFGRKSDQWVFADFASSNDNQPDAEGSKDSKLIGPDNAGVESQRAKSEENLAEPTRRDEENCENSTPKEIKANSVVNQATDKNYTKNPSKVEFTYNTDSPSSPDRSYAPVVAIADGSDKSHGNKNHVLEEVSCQEPTQNMSNCNATEEIQKSAVFTRREPSPLHSSPSPHESSPNNHLATTLDEDDGPAPFKSPLSSLEDQKIGRTNPGSDLQVISSDESDPKDEDPDLNIVSNDERDSGEEVSDSEPNFAEEVAFEDEYSDMEDSSNDDITLGDEDSYESEPINYDNARYHQGPPRRHYPFFDTSEDESESDVDMDSVLASDDASSVDSIEESEHSSEVDSESCSKSGDTSSIIFVDEAVNPIDFDPKSRSGSDATGSGGSAEETIRSTNHHIAGDVMDSRALDKDQTYFSPNTQPDQLNSAEEVHPVSEISRTSLVENDSTSTKESLVSRASEETQVLVGRTVETDVDRTPEVLIHHGTHEADSVQNKKEQDTSVDGETTSPQNIEQDEHFSISSNAMISESITYTPYVVDTSQDKNIIQTQMDSESSDVHGHHALEIREHDGQLYKLLDGTEVRVHMDDRSADDNVPNEDERITQQKRDIFQEKSSNDDESVYVEDDQTSPKKGMNLQDDQLPDEEKTYVRDSESSDGQAAEVHHDHMLDEQSVDTENDQLDEREHCLSNDPTNDQGDGYVQYSRLGEAHVQNHQKFDGGKALSRGSAKRPSQDESDDSNHKIDPALRKPVTTSNIEIIDLESGEEDDTPTSPLVKEEYVPDQFPPTSIGQHNSNDLSTIQKKDEQLLLDSMSPVSDSENTEEDLYQEASKGIPDYKLVQSNKSPDEDVASEIPPTISGVLHGDLTKTPSEAISQIEASDSQLEGNRSQPTTAVVKKGSRSDPEADPNFREQLLTPKASQQTSLLTELSTLSHPNQEIHDLPTPALTQSTVAPPPVLDTPETPRKPTLVEKIKAMKRLSARSAKRTSTKVLEAVSPWFIEKKKSQLTHVSDSESNVESEHSENSVHPEVHRRQSQAEPLLPEPHTQSSLREKQSSPAYRQPVSSPSAPPTGLRTSFSYFPPLSSLSTHFNTQTDILAIVYASTAVMRAKSGPRDYSQTLSITDPPVASSAHPITTAQIFRPYKTAFPSVAQGDAILLRNFKVQSFGNTLGLLSTDSSAWAVFRRGEDVKMAGPPVEFGAAERGYARGLWSWWDSLSAAKKSELEQVLEERKKAGMQEESKEKIETEKLTSPKKTPKRRGRPRGRPSRGEGVVRHELRDGVSYTDGKGTLHELRDGTTYSDSVEP